jgi:predicted amidophosphoribosyltransferase
VVSWLVLDSLLDALAVLFPVDCAGCGGPDRSVCPVCRSAVLGHTPTESSPAAGLRVVSATRYDGVVRGLVLALKEGGRTDAAPTLAAAIAPLLGSASDLALVPQSAEAARRRGYDPVRLIVRRAGYRCPPVLAVRRETAAQKSLDIAGRAANRAGSLVARGSLAGRRLVLVDDVMTTGATLIEARRAIEEAGGVVDFSVTVAATPRLFGSFR